jgi:hypothetical protein
MKYLIFTLFICLSFAACKTEPSQPKAQYPEFWGENNVPKYENGLLSKISQKIEDLKATHTVLVQTEEGFDEIHKWHMDEFKANGWKNVKNLRKNIGQDDELMILVHTKAKVKHSITVLKSSDLTQDIKTVVSKFGS